LQLLATNKIKPGELPFEQFILDAIVKGANRDIVENALFKGTYNDAGTTPAATLTGFLVTALADVPTGYKYDVAAALSSANIIDAMDATYDKLHEKQKNNPKVKAFVSPAIQKMYARAVRDTYNTTITDVVDGKRKWFIYDTDVEIVSEIGLAGSDHILITDTDNMCVGFDNKLDASSITIQPFDRYLKVMLDFEMGVQFREVTNGRVALSYDAA